MRRLSHIALLFCLTGTVLGNIPRTDPALAGIGLLTYAGAPNSVAGSWGGGVSFFLTALPAA